MIPLRGINANPILHANQEIKVNVKDLPPSRDSAKAQQKDKTTPLANIKMRAEGYIKEALSYGSKSLGSGFSSALISLTQDPKEKLEKHLLTGTPINKENLKSMGNAISLTLGFFITKAFIPKEKPIDMKHLNAKTDVTKFSDKQLNGLQSMHLHKLTENQMHKLDLTKVSGYQLSIFLDTSNAKNVSKEQVIKILNSEEHKKFLTGDQILTLQNIINTGS